MSEETTNNSLYGAKVKAIFSGALGSAFVGSIVAVFLTLYLKNNVDNNLLTVWCAVVLLLGIIRIIITVGHNKRKHLLPLKSWGLYYLVSTYLFATAWASISLIMINVLPPKTDPFFVTLLLGMASGGAISHISNKYLAQYYCMSIIFLHSMKTLIEAREDSFLIVAAEILYILLLRKTIVSFNALYSKSQDMALELQDKLELEKEFQKQKVQALQKSKLASLGEMAAGMAHEINNPLTISIGKLDVLNRLIKKTEGLPAPFYTQIEAIINANKRAGAIVNSIRNLSRMKEESEFQEFEVSELVELVKPLISIKLAGNDIELKEQFENLSVYADKGEISQVLLNIMNNAIDAIKDNENKKWIEITTEMFDDQVYIKIKDSGLIENIDNPAKIFEPFYTTKDIGDGTGLGLSLSRNIMGRNGGSITIDTSGINTCFIMSVKSAKSST